MVGQFVGYPFWTLCVDPIWSSQLSEQSALYTEGRLLGQLRLGWCGQGLGHSYGERKVKVKFRSRYDTGPYAANSLSYDKSGQFLAVAGDDGNIKIINDVTQKIEATLKGHEDAVLDVLFDFNSKVLISSSADFSFRVWS